MTISRWMGKEVVVHIQNEILLSHKKEQIWVSCTEVDEPRACYMEWSKSEREKQISYINAYMWNLETQYWWIYSQGRNGDADVENGLVDRVRVGESGMNEENSINICTLSCIKQQMRSCFVTQEAQLDALWGPKGTGWGSRRGYRYNYG